MGETTWEEIDKDVAANFGWSGGNTDGFGPAPRPRRLSRSAARVLITLGGPAGGGMGLPSAAEGALLTLRRRSSRHRTSASSSMPDLSAGWIRVFDPGKKPRGSGL